jgi:hypothetical protein
MLGHTLREDGRDGVVDMPISLCNDKRENCVAVDEGASPEEV